MTAGPLLAESRHSRRHPRPQIQPSGIYRASECPLTTQSGLMQCSKIGLESNDSNVRFRPKADTQAPEKGPATDRVLFREIINCFRPDEVIRSILIRVTQTLYLQALQSGVV